LHAGRDLDDDDRGYDPVDGHAERWPPSGVGDEVAAMLPEILEAVPDKAHDEEPRGTGDRGSADDDECKVTPLSTAMTFGRRSATAKPTWIDAITTSPSA
jgi:hypothetical protein